NACGTNVQPARYPTAGVILTRIGASYDGLEEVQRNRAAATTRAVEALRQLFNVLRLDAYCQQLFFDTFPIKALPQRGAGPQSLVPGEVSHELAGFIPAALVDTGFDLEEPAPTLDDDIDPETGVLSEHDETLLGSNGFISILEKDQRETFALLNLRLEQCYV